MANIFDITPNEVTTDLTGYPLVLMGATGDGKTFTLDKMLREINPLPPLFIMFENRYQHIPGILATKINNYSDLEMTKAQLKSPKAKEMFGSIVIDTVDAMDVMIEKYIADTKNVEVTGELLMGMGNKYIKSKLHFIDELRNDGWTIHFAVQCTKNTNIITNKTTYDVAVNKETWKKVSQNAYLIGMVEVDNKDNRTVTFKKTAEYLNLKDSVGIKKIKFDYKDFKKEFEGAIKGIEGATFTNKNTIKEVAVVGISFDEVKAKGTELGSKLSANGKLDEALTILKLNIGQDSKGNALMFDSLQPNQLDLAKVVVIKLEELCTKYGIK